MFEHVYFARPDSYVFGRSVNDVRTELGRVLAREAPADADVVVPIPDSGVCAATGFAEEAKLPLRMGLIRNHYVGRTFIQPQQSIRHFGVKVKLNPVRSILEGKTRRAAGRLARPRHDEPEDREDGEGRRARAKCTCESAARRPMSPCFYGVDTPSRAELIAATHTIEEIRKYVGADSAGVPEPRGPARGASAREQHSYCTSCYTGRVSGGVSARTSRPISSSPSKSID